MLHLSVPSKEGEPVELLGESLRGWWEACRRWVEHSEAEGLFALDEASLDEAHQDRMAQALTIAPRHLEAAILEWSGDPAADTTVPFLWWLKAPETVILLEQGVLLVVETQVKTLDVQWVADLLSTLTQRPCQLALVWDGRYAGDTTGQVERA